MGKLKTAPKVNNDENLNQVTDSPLLMLQSLTVGMVVLRMKTRNVAHVKVMFINYDDGGNVDDIDHVDDDECDDEHEARLAKVTWVR